MTDGEERMFRICQAETSRVRTLIHRSQQRNVLHYTPGGRKTQSFAALLSEELFAQTAPAKSKMRRGPHVQTSVLFEVNRLGRSVELAFGQR